MKRVTRSSLSPNAKNCSFSLELGDVSKMEINEQQFLLCHDNVGGLCFRLKNVITARCCDPSPYPNEILDGGRTLLYCVSNRANAVRRAMEEGTFFVAFAVSWSGHYHLGVYTATEVAEHVVRDKPYTRVTLQRQFMPWCDELFLGRVERAFPNDGVRKHAAAAMQSAMQSASMDFDDILGTAEGAPKRHIVQHEDGPVSSIRPSHIVRHTGNAPVGTAVYGNERRMLQSKVEAYWALFYKLMQIPFTYETVICELPVSRAMYKPDFALQLAGRAAALFVEIKAERGGTPEAISRCQQFANIIAPIVLVEGRPTGYTAKMYSRGLPPTPVTLAYSPLNGWDFVNVDAAAQSAAVSDEMLAPTLHFLRSVDFEAREGSSSASLTMGDAPMPLL